MSRHREKLEPYQVAIVGPFGSSTAPYQDEGHLVRLDKLSYSVMDDSLSLSKRYSCNPVSHYRVQGSVFHTTASRNMLNWDHSIGVRNYSLSCAASPISYAGYLTIPSTDWVSLVVDLAHSVQGLIRSKTLLGATFGELHKTVEMMINPFQLIKRAKLDPGTTFGRLARKSSNVWLEYNYGWRAFKYDLDNLMVSLGKYCGTASPWSNPQQCSRFSSSRKSCGSMPNPTISNSDWKVKLAQCENPDYGFPYSNGAKIRIVYGTPVYDYRLSCWAVDSVVGPAVNLSRLISILGLDLPGLMNTWWELVPYSFVVDWFFNTKALLNLPEYLSAQNALSSASVHDLCFTSKGVLDYHAEAIPHHYPSDGTSSETYWAHSGYHSTSWPANPPVMVGEPGSIHAFQRGIGLPDTGVALWNGIGLSLSQITSGISLITQRTRRKM